MELRTTFNKRNLELMLKGSLETINRIGGGGKVTEGEKMLPGIL